MLRVVDKRTLKSERPIRILHVVGVMNRAGIETWLMHTLRAIDRDRFAMDFVVETDQPGDYDEELLSLGSRILCAGPRHPLRYGSRFRRILREHGPYDVVHSHLNHYNGYVMWLARRAGVPVRISHSHTDTTAKERSAGLTRRFFVRLMRESINRLSTHGLAASVPAAISMFGTQWKHWDHFDVMHCGIDLSPFAQTYDRVATRAELQIPEDAWVVGHVGRMDAVKNHEFIIDTFAGILPQADNAYLLLVGEGPLRTDIEDRARKLGVSDRVRFAGNRNDVPRVLCAAVDAFVFPSKLEGLGIALVEAQAAGLPCLVSDVVPEEADIVPRLVTRLPLNDPWSANLLGLRNHTRQQRQCLDQVLRTDFSIQEGVAALEHTYEQADGAIGRNARVEAIK